MRRALREIGVEEPVLLLVTERNGFHGSFLLSGVLMILRSSGEEKG
jgi:hypothetical protein